MFKSLCAQFTVCIPLLTVCSVQCAMDIFTHCVFKSLRVQFTVCILLLTVCNVQCAIYCVLSCTVCRPVPPNISFRRMGACLLVLGTRVGKGRDFQWGAHARRALLSKLNRETAGLGHRGRLHQRGVCDGGLEEPNGHLSVELFVLGIRLSVLTGGPLAVGDPVRWWAADPERAAWRRPTRAPAPAPTPARAAARPGSPSPPQSQWCG